MFPLNMIVDSKGSKFNESPLIIYH